MADSGDVHVEENDIGVSDIGSQFNSNDDSKIEHEFDVDDFMSEDVFLDEDGDGDYVSDVDGGNGMYFYV